MSSGKNAVDLAPAGPVAYSIPCRLCVVHPCIWAQCGRNAEAFLGTSTPRRIMGTFCWSPLRRILVDFIDHVSKTKYSEATLARHVTGTPLSADKPLPLLSDAI